MNDQVSGLSSRLQAINSAHVIFYYTPGVRTVKMMDGLLCTAALTSEAFSPAQKPGGLMFPDRAALYVVAIEDRQYKDFKIHCE